MLQNLQTKRRNAKGFTIIEVLIVLAIGGLIIAIVLVAIPQLQRNQRNESRRNIMGRMKTEIDNYSGNNNGQIPDSAADVTDLTNRYLSGINRNDPQSGTPMNVTRPAADPPDGVPTGANLPAVGAIFYREGNSCDGEQMAAGSGRTYALWTQLEGGAVYCLDNE